MYACLKKLPQGAFLIEEHDFIGLKCPLCFKGKKSIEEFDKGKK